MTTFEEKLTDLCGRVKDHRIHDIIRHGGGGITWIRVMTVIVTMRPTGKNKS